MSRVLLKVYVDSELASRVDDARGLAPTSAWVRHAILRHLDHGGRPIPMERPPEPDRSNVHEIRPPKAAAFIPTGKELLEVADDEPEDDVEPYSSMPDLRVTGGRRTEEDSDS